MQLKIAAVIAGTVILVAACSKSEPQQAVPAEPPAASAAPAGGAAPAPPPAPPAEAAPASSAAVPAAAPAPAPEAPASRAVAAPAAAPAPAPAPPPEPPKPRVAQLKSGETITVRMTRELSTKRRRTAMCSRRLSMSQSNRGVGRRWRGCACRGPRRRIGQGRPDQGQGQHHGRAHQPDDVRRPEVDIVTSPVGSEAVKKKGSDAKKIGIGAGAGAAVGAIAGGGQGAAIGALVGGGAGAAMRGEAAEIPAEALMSFVLRSPVTIREKK